MTDILPIMYVLISECFQSTYMQYNSLLILSYHSNYNYSGTYQTVLSFRLPKMYVQQIFHDHLHHLTAIKYICNAHVQVSFTPCMGQLLSYPPHQRQTFSGYLLLGVLPPKVQNYNVLYGAVLKHIRSTGLPVDTFKQEYCEKVSPLCSFRAEDHACTPPQLVTKHIVINSVLEDTRGLPNPTCSKQSPAVHGACCKCDVCGVYDKNRGTTTYIGAVRCLGNR